MLSKHIQLISSLSGHDMFRIISCSFICLYTSYVNRHSNDFIWCYFFSLLAQIELLLNQGSICKSRVYWIFFLYIILVSYSNGFYNQRWKIILFVNKRIFSSRCVFVLFFLFLTLKNCDMRVYFNVSVVRWFVSLSLSFCFV